MTEQLFNRRHLLRLAGVAAVGTSGFVQTGMAEESPGGELVWEFQTDGVVESSPTVVNNTVYIGSNDHRLYAIDADTGSEQWHFETEMPILSPPTVVDDTVYIGSDDDHLYAIDANDGSERWSLDTGSGAVSPTIKNGIVYVLNHSGLYAIDVDDGSELWSFEQGGWGSPTVVRDTVYIGTYQGLYAVDATDGDEQWSFDVPEGVYSSPTVVGDVVYFGGFDSHVYAAGAANGTKQWQFETVEGVYSSPTIANNTLFIGSGQFENDEGEDGGIYALNIGSDDAELKWKVSVENPVMSSPTVVQDTIYISGTNEKTYALNVSDGTERWQFDDGYRSSPTVVDGIVYIGGFNKIYALNADSERISDGSRVNLGTLGHHHIWAEEATEDDDEPVEITDWHDLNAVRDNVDDDYVLMNDLNEETAGYDEHVAEQKGGWEPIGDGEFPDPDEEAEFTGTFDGNGHTIMSLRIDRPDEDTGVGLFGGVFEGEITDVTLANTEITGAISGGLIGVNTGTVQRCVNRGDVTAGAEEGSAGGLIGLNGGDVHSSAATGSVGSTGEDNSVGGLVGTNGSGEVSDAFANCEVTGDGTFAVGGLAGRNLAEIESVWVGGPVGEGDAVGGLVGENTGQLTEAYWDIEVTGQSAGVGSGGDDLAEAGLSTAEMQGQEAEENMTALDFEETWDIVTDPDDYPILQFQDEPVADPPEQPSLTVHALEIGTVAPDEMFSVAVTVEETAGIVAEEVEATLTVSQNGGNATAYDETFTVSKLAAATETAITFGEDENTSEVGPLAEGDYEATVEVVAANAETVSTSASFSVNQPPEELTAEDFITRDEEGDVEDVDVFDAIDAFRDGRLESSELFDVISAFREA